MNPKTLFIVFLITAVGVILYDRHQLALLPKNTASTPVNLSPASKGTVIGYIVFSADKAASTTGKNAPAIITENGKVAVTYSSSGIPPEVFAKYVQELAVTDSALTNFFKILEQQQVPRCDLDSKLREIAISFKNLLYRMETMQSIDPQVAAKVKQAIEAGNYNKAETMLEDVAKQHSISAAETYVVLASLQEVQLRYDKAAVSWQMAAVLLPEEKKKEFLFYLGNAAYDLHRIARYADALTLWVQLGDKVGEAATSWDIGLTYKKQGKLRKAEPYLSRAVQLAEEIGHPSLEKWRKTLERIRAKLRGR